MKSSDEMIAAPSRTDATAKPIQRRLMIPLAAMLLLLIGTFGFLLVKQQKDNLNQYSLDKLKTASADMKTLLAEQSQTLEALGQVLIQDPRLRAALKARDRKRLLANYQAVFTKLKTDHGLTHFYFISTDRVCLLRVHKPEKHGDLIDRFTMLEAKRSGRTAAGIELGPLGTFTLRSVQPVYDGNALIGYLELGKEIEEILNYLHKKDNIDITVVIHKDALHRATWEAGMKMLNREADWSYFTSDVLIYSSLSRFPVELEHFIGKGRHKHNQVSKEEVFSGQPWKISVIPLLDVSGTNVGDMLILYNISAAKASYHQVMIIAIGAGLLILGLLFGFLFILLGRIDRSIIIQHTALRNSEEKFRALAITSPTAIFIHQQGTFVYANPAALEISGFTLDEILQMKFWELVHPDIREQVKNFGQQREARTGADIPQRYEMKIITKQGDIKWLDFNAATIEFNGKPAIMGNVIDITDRKNGENELLSEKERLAVTLSSIGDGVIAVDLSGKITLMNAAAEEITGWTADIALGRNLAVILSLTTENNSEPPVDLSRQVQKTGAPCYRQELVSIYSDDGEEKIIADSAAPIRNQDGKIIGIIIVIRDITEKVRIRKELETSQNLESIGLLAGGIAHDFNNLLTAIYGNISLAKMYPDDKNKVFHYLDKTENSLAQAKALTEQLLTFAKGGSPVKQLVNIGPLLEEIAKFSLRGSKTNLQTDIAADLWLAEVDTGQFSQVINNLAINANQAMPSGGTLTIKAENMLLSPMEIIPEKENDYYIKITVADQGFGISQKHLDKIFAPYFTTKHEGSGLGLATVYSIIKNHHGQIKAESEVGKGSTFTILLPASGATAESNIEAQDSTETGQTGSGKILIMDDEEVVREICGEMIVAMGHTVDYAANGQEALEKYQQSMGEQQPFDLVIMDLTIPGGMGGKETISKLLKIDPQAKAIVSSGYSHDDVMANYQDYGFHGVAAKPYLFSDLNKVIQNLIQ